MATFNFSKNKKSEGNLDDKHTEMRLKDQHVKEQDVVTEKQLDKKDRTEEPEVIMEKLLEQVRVGSADVVIEKNLSDSKGLFNSKHRNPEAYKGDINKLEEKRLSGDNTEDEKYEASSSTSKKSRWWDGLRKANSKNTVKTAKRENEEDWSEESRFNRLRDDEEIKDDSFDIDHDEPIDESETEDENIEKERGSSQDMFVLKNKDGKSPLPHVYMQLAFDSSLFDDDTAIKEAALEKILDIRPSLEGKITIDDLSDPEYSSTGSTISTRLIGPEYLSTEPAEPSETGEQGKVIKEDLLGGKLFSNIEFESVDVGGTIMNVGKVTLSPSTKGMDQEYLEGEVAKYISDKIGYEIPEGSVSVDFNKMQAVYSFNEDPTIGDLSVEKTNLSDSLDIEDDGETSETTEPPEVEETEEVKPATDIEQNIQAINQESEQGGSAEDFSVEVVPDDVEVVPDDVEVVPDDVEVVPDDEDFEVILDEDPLDPANKTASKKKR